MCWRLHPTARFQRWVLPGVPCDLGRARMKGTERDANPTAGAERQEVMTLLFTDLVGAMALKEDLGNVEALRLIREHHDLVRALLRNFPEAREISTAGDSFFLAFRRPAEAVAFALRLQSRLRLWNRDRPHPLEDRIGIHSGEVTVATDSSGQVRDLNGLEVDRCARLMSLASGRQILVTRFVFDNARAALKGQPIPEVGAVRWISHGDYEFKGAPGPVEVLEVGEPGLARLEAPPDSEKARRVEAAAAEAGAPPTGWRRWVGLTQATRRAAWSGAALACVAGLVGLYPPELMEPVRNASYDLAYLFRPAERPEEGVILGMDQATMKALRGLNEFRLDRRLHAGLIRQMAGDGARAVVLDVACEQSAPEEDAALIAAARAFPATNVVLVGLVSAEVGRDRQIVTPLPPAPELADALPWGLADYPRSSDDVRRRMDSGPTEIEHAAVMVAQRLGRSPPPRGVTVWLNYYGPKGTIPTVSYLDVHSNQVAGTVFSNKVVFIGSTHQVDLPSKRVDDPHSTPYTRWGGEKSHGVEVLATTTLNLLRDDWLRPFPEWLTLLILTAVGLGAGYGLARLRPLAALLAATVLGTLIAAAAIALVWRTLHWFPWLIVSGVQLPLALAWSVIASANAALRPPVRVAARGGRAAGATRRVSVGSDLPPAPAPRPAADTLVEGVPNYRFLREIGRGAYGQVWLAEDAIGQLRAVKVVRRGAFPDDRPYEREFAGIKRFTPLSREHPGLIQVLHVGRDDRAQCFHYVMELADDETRGQDFSPESYAPRTLGNLLQTCGSLAVADVIDLGIGLAEALEFLHARQLIHRDLKPANVLYVRGRPKLADIGLVTTMGAPGDEVSALGTEGYIPPEGPGAATGDIYSLGKVLYVAATGRKAMDFPELPTKTGELPEAERLLALNQVWLKACDPEAARRHCSAAALAAELRGLLAPTIEHPQGQAGGK